MSEHEGNRGQGEVERRIVEATKHREPKICVEGNWPDEPNWIKERFVQGIAQEGAEAVQHPSEIEALAEAIEAMKHPDGTESSQSLALAALRSRLTGGDADARWPEDFAGLSADDRVYRAVLDAFAPEWRTTKRADYAVIEKAIAVTRSLSAAKGETT